MIAQAYIDISQGAGEVFVLLPLSAEINQRRKAYIRAHFSFTPFSSTQPLLSFTSTSTLRFDFW